MEYSCYYLINSCHFTWDCARAFVCVRACTHTNARAGLSAQTFASVCYQGAVVFIFPFPVVNCCTGFLQGRFSYFVQQSNERQRAKTTPSNEWKRLNYFFRMFRKHLDRKLENLWFWQEAKAVNTMYLVLSKFTFHKIQLPRIDYVLHNARSLARTIPAQSFFFPLDQIWNCCMVH